MAATTGLIINRGRFERIYIGADICIEVHEIRGQHVKLRVSAPKGVGIYREELLFADAACRVKCRQDDHLKMREET